MAIVLSGCYNDDKLWNALDEQEQRIEALESWQKVMNSNIEALQSLVDGQDYITKVTPVTLNGEVVGYTITFKSQSPITIYNGEKVTKAIKAIRVSQPMYLSSASSGRKTGIGTGR